jgi:hypothetical protein
LNNCVAFQQQYIQGASVARITRLREYTEAMIEAPLEHFADGLLSAEELSFVFSSAALLVFLKANNLKNIPQKPVAEEFVDVE